MAVGNLDDQRTGTRQFELADSVADQFDQLMGDQDDGLSVISEIIDDLQQAMNKM